MLRDEVKRIQTSSATGRRPSSYGPGGPSSRARERGANEAGGGGMDRRGWKGGVQRSHGASALELGRGVPSLGGFRPILAEEFLVRRGGNRHFDRPLRDTDLFSGGSVPPPSLAVGQVPSVAPSRFRAELTSLRSLSSPWFRTRRTRCLPFSPRSRRGPTGFNPPFRRGGDAGGTRLISRLTSMGTGFGGTRSTWTWIVLRSDRALRRRKTRVKKPRVGLSNPSSGCGLHLRAGSGSIGRVEAEKRGESRSEGTQHLVGKAPGESKHGKRTERTRWVPR